MSESFYPFVENGSGADAQDITPPLYTARIAIYDAMTVPPRVVMIPPSDVRTYLDEITKNVWELATQQGGDWPFHIIRELVENYIHASFIEPTISIMDKGQTISFSDQGPGIPNKQAALRPTFSSATAAMKRYIRGTGSGLPMVEAQVKLQHGTITIEDNLNQGVVVTVSLVNKDQPENPQPPQPAAPIQAPQGYYQQRYSSMPAYQNAYPPQPMPFPAAAPQAPAYQSRVPVQHAGAPTPYGTVSPEVKNILKMFATTDKIGATEVSEALGISKPTGTRRLKEMGEKGLVVKSGQKYVLTDGGQSLLATILNEG